MGVPLTDEADLMRQAIKMVQELTDLPICIDSSVLEALEAGLQTYQGRALVNSTTGEDDRLDHILPLVKKYDAAIIALPNDETEIPMTVEDRLKITEKILRACDKHGISHDRLVIDPLAMPIGAEPQAGNLFFETVHQIKQRWDLNMTCGASNVSFGMPNRHAVNAAFLPAAFLTGLAASSVAGLAFGNASIKRRATGGSIVDEALVTNSPISFNLASTTLLSIPSCFANSCTRTFATFLLRGLRVNVYTRNLVLFPHDRAVLISVSFSFHPFRLN